MLICPNYTTYNPYLIWLSKVTRLKATFRCQSLIKTVLRTRDVMNKADHLEHIHPENIDNSLGAEYSLRSLFNPKK